MYFYGFFQIVFCILCTFFQWCFSYVLTVAMTVLVFCKFESECAIASIFRLDIVFATKKNVKSRANFFITSSPFDTFCVK